MPAASFVRRSLTLLVSLGCASAALADDGVLLDVSLGASPGEVRLDWSGGVSSFRVYRATAPYQMVDPANELGVTSGSAWLDIPPAGPIYYYRVVGPCQFPSAEACDGVDDDCDGTIDNGCGPCFTDTDCDDFDQLPICSVVSSCQGTRQEGVCNAASQCVSATLDDDSGCSGLTSSECGPYPPVICTASPTQPTNQDALCAISCADDAACDPAGHCDETQSVCLDDFPAGFGCVAADDCDSGLCTDGVCCNSTCTGTCAACDLTGTTGTCSAVPNGQDPDSECAGTACTQFYWGFSGDTCYRKADVGAAQAACGGDLMCRTTAEECTAQTAQGPATLTCHSLCQEPTGGTCSGTTAGRCTNVNPGTQTCGVGACQMTVAQCSNGVPVICVPGTPTTETCNDVDDNCDGTIDNGSFSDGQEANDSCTAFRSLPTAGSEQTLTQNTLSVYPSGDIDYFRITGTESDSSCACCDFFCTDEDYELVITLTVPPGAGSYQFCTDFACASVGNNCRLVNAGSSATWRYALDGGCGGGNDSYSVFVRISPGNAPGFECRPYTLSYFFDSGRCF